MKYAFILQHKARHSLLSLSKVLRVSRSGYYDWRNRMPSARALANHELLAHIHASHARHRKAYGALKTWR